MGLQTWGAVRLGDIGDLLNAGGELVQKGVSTYQAHEQAKTSAANAQANLDQLISADAAAAEALAQSAVAEGALATAPHDVTLTAIANATSLAATSAEDQEDGLAATLDPSLAPKRIKAAKAALNQAIAALKKAPLDALAKQRVTAWQAVLAKAGGAPAASSLAASAAASATSMFSNVTAGQMAAAGGLLGSLVGLAFAPGRKLLGALGGLVAGASFGELVGKYVGR